MLDGFKTWWENVQRAGAQKAPADADADADAAYRRAMTGLSGLRRLSDDQLIAQAGPRNGLDPPREEMEMQRRLKDAMLAQVAESRKGRIWGAWGTAVIAMLTIVVIVLTIVLIRRG